LTLPSRRGRSTALRAPAGGTRPGQRLPAALAAGRGRVGRHGGRGAGRAVPRSRRPAGAQGGQRPGVPRRRGRGPAGAVGRLAAVLAAAGAEL
jgi:hypothetical protein